MSFLDAITLSVTGAEGSAQGTFVDVQRVTREGAVHNGAFDAPYVSEIERFESMSHAEIYSRIQQMTPRALSVLAGRWEELGEGLRSAFGDFASALSLSMEGWEGRSREAAETASRAFAQAGEEFADITSKVAPRISEIAGVGFALQSQIRPPSEEVPTGPVNGLPLPAETIAAAERAEEARQQAVAAMNTLYVPTFAPGVGVGDKVPAFFSPEDPAPGFGEGGESQVSGGGGGTTGSGGGGGNNSGVTRSGTGETPTDQLALDESAAQTQPTLDQQVPGTTQQAASTMPAAETGDRVVPANFTPAGSTVGTGIPNGGNDFSRAGGSLPGQGSGGGGAFGQQPGSPFAHPLAASPAANPAGVAAGPAGRSGAARMMPGSGMVPGAGAAQRRDDDNEHKTPSYLVSDENAKELIGEIPKAAPPVIGVWDDRK